MLNIFKNIFAKSPWEDNEPTNIFSKHKNNKPNYPNYQFNFNLSNNFIFLILGGLIVLWLSSGFYRVEEGEEAAILRFGKYVRKASPGLNYRLPVPFEVALKERVNNSRRIEIGYRSYGFSKNKTDNIKAIPTESIMLTGDENIIDLTVDITWHIKDLEAYLFNIKNPEDTVKMVAESAIREDIGRTPISSILSDKKEKIADDIAASLQKILDQYNTGVEIENVQLLKAEPPSEVIAAYRDVQTAKADKEREINQAEAYKNDILPRARGEAAKIIQEAEGYKQEIVSKAEGDTNRFTAVYKQYVLNPQITKDRLYLETIQKVLKDTNKVIVDSQSILPHMALLQNKSN